MDHTSFDEYLHHVESVCACNPELTTITDEGESPPIVVASCSDIPEPGCLTAFSYGLSSVAHPEWIAGRPELVVSVDSTDRAWAFAMGELIRNGRHKCLFSCGNILDFGQPISDESAMTHFLVFGCSVLDLPERRVVLSDRTVNLVQLYPIHASEATLILNMGAEAFMSQQIDFFNVRRCAFHLAP